MWHVRGKGEMHTEFWWGNLREEITLKICGDHIKLISKNLRVGLECVDLAQDSGKGQGCLRTFVFFKRKGIC